MLDEKFYTTEQVANVLQVHPFTILKFIKQGKLQGIKIGRMYRIRESEVSRFLEERMTQPSRTKKKKIEQPKPEPKVEEVVSAPEPKPEVKPVAPPLQTLEQSYNIETQEEKSDGEHYYII